MRISKGFKKTMACALSLAMAVTMVPAGNLQTVKAAGTDDNMVLHWDMTQNDADELIDLTGNNNNGIVQGAVEAGQIEGIDVQQLKGGYAEIPDGTITDDMTEVTINILVKITENIKSSWMFCIGTSNKRYLYLTGCSNQNSCLRGGVGCVPDTDGDGEPDGNGWSYESVVTGDAALDANQWQNITVTYKDGGVFAFYKNGEFVSSADLATGNAGTFTLQDLMKAGDDLDGYMGWSFYGSNDPKFQGSVADFRIYDKELSQTEVSELYTEVNDMLESLAEGDFSSADINLTEEDCLGTNTSATAVTTDLVLPTKTTIGKYNKSADITAWSSSNPNIISNTGKVTQPVKDTTVTLTASVTANSKTEDKELTFTVLGNMSDADAIKEDTAALDIFQKDDIRGNITLPTKGENGSVITWKSSNEAVISTVAKGSMAPGVVNRQAADTKVTLTATLTRAGMTATKAIVCTVKKAPKEVVTTDYLFAYFPYTSTKDERIYFGISEDGLVFNALNDSKFVLESVEGTHGLRDPFVIRSKEGDKFYLIATDLTVAGVTQDGTTYPGQNWDKNQTEGSQCIMVWESEDLVNWSKQRMCHVAADNAGCTWAPEAYYDDTTGEYLVFWASKTGDDGYAKQRVWCATTRDFNTFSEPEVWIEASGSVIDTTVMKAGDYYYRYTKNEDGSTINGTPSKRVYCERSKSLKGTWERVANNSLPVSGGQIEGPTIYKINDDDVENAKEVAGLLNITLEGDQIYCLAADQTGSTIFPGLTDDITSGEFNPLGTSKTVSAGGRKVYAMPDPDASHGTIMPITSEEYNNLMLAYDSRYKASADKYIKMTQAAANAIKVPAATESNITLPTTVSGTTVTWESSNPAVVSTAGKVTIPAKDTTVTLTATITAKGADGVRDQVCTKSYTVTVKADKTLAVGTKKTVGDANYVVTNATKGAAEVTYAGPVSKKIKTGKVPTTVAIDGVTYKVTKIADNAFKKCTKMTKITVPLGITEIGKNAFNGCKSLKTITIKSTTLKKVGKSAFKGISKKATIKVPKKNKKAYQKLLKKKGQASTVKIK